VSFSRRPGEGRAHSHRPSLSSQSRRPPSSNTSAAAYGSRPSPGRRNCSRGVFRPSFPNSLSLLKNRGSRECRVRAAPAVSCAKLRKESAHEHTGEAEAFRHPLRDGFTAYIVISPVSGLVVTVTCEYLRKLDASIAAPGPHDFAVRGQRFVRRKKRRRRQRPPHPIPTCGGDGQRPSLGMRRCSL
jgi:hypothetical protein